MYRNTVTVVPDGLVVNLSQGKVAIVDNSEEARLLLIAYRWHVYYNGKPDIYYMARWDSATRRRVLYQREILGERAVGQYVYHLDGNTLNCRRYTVDFTLNDKSLGLISR